MSEKRTKAELREAAEALVKDYNAAILDGNFDEAHKLDDEIVQTVNEYTSEARREAFEKLANTENPMLEAVKQLTFTSIRVRETKTEDEAKVPVRVIEEVEKPIDLRKLNKFVKDGIGENPRWVHMVEKLNYLMTAQKAVDLGINPKEINKYAMSEIAKEIDMGKTPTSKTNILKTIQSVITAMIGEEYKATSHDVNYLLSIYCKKNRKALTVSCANHKYMTQYIAEICHRIVLGKTYEVEYKQSK